MMDRRLLKASVVGGLSKDDAQHKLDKLAAVGAMPMRRHFLKKRATGKSTLSTKRRKIKRLNNSIDSSNNTIGTDNDDSSSGSSSRPSPAR